MGNKGSKRGVGLGNPVTLHRRGIQKPCDTAQERDPYPMTDPCMLYMATFTINIPQMLAYIPYMDPMGMDCREVSSWFIYANQGDLKSS